MTVRNWQVVPALNPFRTRLASLSDLPAICAIEDNSFHAPYPQSLLKRLLEDCSQSFFVALDNEGSLVGYCVISLSPDSAHLISIAVHSRLRRKGVATLLLQRTVEYLSSHNVDELRLEVGVNNMEALSLYGKLGFEKMGLLKAYYSDGSDAVSMRLFSRAATSKLP